MDDELDPAGPIDAPQDRLGCFTYLFRFSGCFLITYIIMFVAIICAALFGFFFWHR